MQLTCWVRLHDGAGIRYFPPQLAAPVKRKKTHRKGGFEIFNCRTYSTEQLRLQRKGAGTVSDFRTHALTFSQRFSKPLVIRIARRVYEHVFAAIFRSNEIESFTDSLNTNGAILDIKITFT